MFILLGKQLEISQFRKKNSVVVLQIKKQDLFENLSKCIKVMKYIWY